MTDGPGAEELLAQLSVERHDGVAVAVSSGLALGVVAGLAEAIVLRLDRAGVPSWQRVWIVAADGSSEQSASVLGVLSEVVGGDRLVLHDPGDADGLIFQRRLVGERRGGVYLNGEWQLASVRIGCGEGWSVAGGLCGGFNDGGMLRVEVDLGGVLWLG